LTAEQPVHPIIHEFQDADTWKLCRLFLIACVVAPVIEETIFRGAFYNYLRQNHSVILSAVITGSIFALLHPQGLVAVPVLGAVGLVFALLREWRGSIIAPMAAHACNNFIIMSLVSVLFR
jgi:membrane protease YdiL (CAAX protease family)